MGLRGRGWEGEMEREGKGFWSVVEDGARERVRYISRERIWKIRIEAGGWYGMLGGVIRITGRGFERSRGKRKGLFFLVQTRGNGDFGGFMLLRIQR